MRILLLIIFILYISSKICSGPVYMESEKSTEKKSRVEIQFISRNKRDTADGFDLEIKTFDRIHRLCLRSHGSLFTDSFAYFDLGIDENMNVIPAENTPSKSEIESIQENIYADFSKGAVLKIVQDVDGQLQMNGLIGSTLINFDPKISQHIATKHGNPIDDNVDFKTGIMKRRRQRSTKRKLSVTPEVCFVLDYENSRLFNFDRKRILDYVSILLNAANNRYATMRDPQITLKMSGVYVIKSAAGQSFLEEAKDAAGKIQIPELLKNYSVWIAKNMKKIGAENHDMIPLIFGAEPPNDGAVGQGLAYTGGACGFSKNQSIAASVVYDSGGSWQGAMSLAHELAHSMGTLHDGDGEAKNCPPEEGYIMSYYGFGTPNKFKFSSCSIRLMKKFIQSKEAECLFKRNNRNPPSATKGDIGDRITMTDMCKKRMGNKATLVSDTPDEQCLQLVCENSTMSYQFPELPGDNSKCGIGNNGRCKNGKCVG